MLTTAAPFERLRGEVEEMMRVDPPFEDVEQAIDNAHLTEDRRAALWLVAWSLKRREQED